MRSLSAGSELKAEETSRDFLVVDYRLKVWDVAEKRLHCLKGFKEMEIFRQPTIVPVCRQPTQNRRILSNTLAAGYNDVHQWRLPLASKELLR